jgi:hypothetical protein
MSYVPGSFQIARTAQHRELLRRELAQSRCWGADVREATSAKLSYHHPVSDAYALWCPEDVYIEELSECPCALCCAEHRPGGPSGLPDCAAGVAQDGGQGLEGSGA